MARISSAPKGHRSPPRQNVCEKEKNKQKYEGKWLKSHDPFEIRAADTAIEAIEDISAMRELSRVLRPRFTKAAVHSPVSGVMSVVIAI